MAALPNTTITPGRKIADKTVAAIYGTYRNDGPRSHLGASLLGRDCERQLWYSFRWATHEQFDGRMLRLFTRGKNEERIFVSELELAGLQVHADDGKGAQFRFSHVGGHVGGSMDGAVLGVPEASKTWHVLEIKTHSSKSFATLAAKGVQQAKPEHWTQMQLYMAWSGMERALYLAANKDNDEIYAERLDHDPHHTDAVMAKATRIVAAAEPGAVNRVSADPAYYKCKLCPASKVCHDPVVLPDVNCRTCVHSTPETNTNDGRWSCALHSKLSLSWEEQVAGCDGHRYIPGLIKFAQAVDANEAENWIEYETAAGVTFRNGAPGEMSFDSKELHAGHPAMLTDAAFLSARKMSGARVTGYEPT